MLVIKKAEGDYRHAMWGCRLSYQSTDKCDSTSKVMGVNDYTLALKLIRLGDSHSKFLRAITVTFHLVAPFYWYKQLDQYKVGTVSLSDSTMHNLLKLDKFRQSNFSTYISPLLMNHLNELLTSYKRTRDKEVWYQLIGSLPSSFQQERYWFANYQVLRTIYQQRVNHKLFEWRYFCEQLEKQLTYKEFITL
jgi:hypothetical protein